MWCGEFFFFFFYFFFFFFIIIIKICSSEKEAKGRNQANKAFITTFFQARHLCPTKNMDENSKENSSNETEEKNVGTWFEYLGKLVKTAKKKPAGHPLISSCN